MPKKFRKNIQNSSSIMHYLNRYKYKGELFLLLSCKDQFLEYTYISECHWKSALHSKDTKSVSQSHLQYEQINDDNYSSLFVSFLPDWVNDSDSI